MSSSTKSDKRIAVETPTTGTDGSQLEPVHKLEMIKPPTRGDALALRWVSAGIALYLLLAFVFMLGLVQLGDGFSNSLLDLLGLGEPINPAVFVLVVGGMALTVYTTVTVLADVRTIRAEEDDVDWLLKYGREGAPLTLAPAGKRERLFQEGVRSMPSGKEVRVETLADDRVRRAHAVRMSPGSASIPVEELRVIAERRTVRFGGFARYASSLLLLFAVLGTFAGVKTALPGLIEAVSVAEGQGTGSSATIHAPLKAVSDAFGGNALALIGAIAVGLMAHGLGMGRRNLLERLELASAEYIYGEESSHSADPLRDAVLALRKTAEEIHQSSGTFIGIESGLLSLGTQFKDAFTSLDDRLLQVLNHQESGLYDRTAQTLDELQNRVSELGEVVDVNTRSYAGLVDRIGERAEESRVAMEQMRAANAQLTKALEGMIRLGDASDTLSEEVMGATKLLNDNTMMVAQNIELLTRSVEDSRPAFKQIDTSLQKSAERLSAIETSAARNWEHVGSEIVRRLDEATSRMMKIAAAGNGRSMPMSVGSTGASRAQLVGLPALGVIVGSAVLYLLVRTGVMALLPGF